MNNMVCNQVVESADPTHIHRKTREKENSSYQSSVEDLIYLINIKKYAPFNPKIS